MTATAPTLTRCHDCYHASCRPDDCACRCHRTPVDTNRRCELCVWPPTAPCEGCGTRLCVNHFGPGPQCPECEWMRA